MNPGLLNRIFGREKAVTLKEPPAKKASHEEAVEEAQRKLRELQRAKRRASDAIDDFVGEFSNGNGKGHR